MRHLNPRTVLRSAAQPLAWIQLRSPVAAYTSYHTFLVFSSRRTYHSTQSNYAEGLAGERSDSHNAGVEKKTATSSPRVSASSASSSTTARAFPSSSSSSSSSSPYRKRGEQIRRNEELYRWLRRLVVPAFSLMGLFVLRPTEGHFLRYVAERRHLDTDFNAWFPPVTTPSTRADNEQASAHDDVKKQNKSMEPPSPPSTSSTSKDDTRRTAQMDVLTAFRTPQDRDWAAQKFHYEKGSEDEERVARRRLLFARERAYLPDDTVVETIRSAEEQMAELRALREHPPMHLISEQLDNMMEESKRYKAETSTMTDEANVAASATTTAAGERTTSSSPPQVLIEFEDHRLFATGKIVFRDVEGHVGRTMRFVGACGMLWKQLL